MCGRVQLSDLSEDDYVRLLSDARDEMEATRELERVLSASKSQFGPSAAPANRKAWYDPGL